MACCFYSSRFVSSLLLFLLLNMHISVEKGIFPFYRADDVEEERQGYHCIHLSVLTKSVRRLLYVACTRAQTLLYLTHSSRRKVAGESKTRDLSDFISPISSQSPVGFVCQAIERYRLKFGLPLPAVVLRNASYSFSSRPRPYSKNPL